METVIAYFDETGDDGLVNYSSQDFVLTSICTKADNWQKNYNAVKNCRGLLKEKFGFHSTIEMHTNHNRQGSYRPDEKNRPKSLHEQLVALVFFGWYIKQTDQRTN